MKKGAKIALGVGCGVLLVIVVVIVLGILALNFFEKSVGESMQKYETDGREFGRGTDQQGCISEAMKRSASFGLLDLSAGMGLSAFTDACLGSSRPTSGFCDGVPSFWSMKENEWGMSLCKKAGVDPEKTACIHVTKRKHQFCSKPF